MTQRGVIELPTLMPDGTIAIVSWPENLPLPDDTFTLRPTVDDPNVYDIIKPGDKL
jgi:hypothetical protein